MLESRPGEGAGWIRLLVGRGRWPFVLAVLLLTALLGRQAASSRLEQNNESMNARTPTQQRVLDRFAESFGGDEVIVFAIQDDRLLEAPGLARLRELGRRIEAIDGVDGVLSLTEAVEIVAGRFGAEDVPIVPEGEPPDRETLERALERNRELTGLLISADRRTAGILVELADRPDDDGHQSRIVDELRAIKSGLAADGIESHVTGVTVQKHDTTRFVARDQRVVLPASALVLAVALALINRRISGVLVPLAVTAVALTWTVGIHAGLGLRLNVITSLLPPVVMVLSIATSIHLYQEWVALGSVETDRRRLAVLTVDALGRPCVLTAVTTALGLASLSVSDVRAVREFGTFGAVGVMLSLALNLTLLPVLLSWIDPPRRRLELDSRLRAPLRALAQLTLTRPIAIVAVTVALTVVALAGVARVQNNTDLVRFLDPSSELVIDTQWVDRELVGTSSLDLLIERGDAGPLDRPDDIKRIAQLADRVAELDSVTHVVSIGTVLARLQQAELGLSHPELPTSADELRYLFDLIDASEWRDEIRQLISGDLRRARLAMRIHSMGTAQAQVLVSQIDELARSTLPAGVEASATGTFYRMAVDSNRLVTNQIVSFALAIGLVFVVLGAVFRSAAMLAAAVAPNVVPVIWGTGTMGWLGIDLSTATAMVASVVIGVAVDGTIHYLARFRKHHHGDLPSAVRETTCATGRVLVITSTVLALGFAVGALGSFRPTIWFSLLTGGAIMAALVCDLVVLPACLALTRPCPVVGIAGRSGTGPAVRQV